MGNKKQYKIFFSEEQRLSDSPMKWIFPVIFTVSVGPLGYGMYQQLVLEKPWGDNPMSNLGLILTFVFVVVLMIVIWFLLPYIKLIVYIDKEGIHYRFPIFIRKERLIKKEQIVSYDVRKSRPQFEFSGWNYRTGFIYINRGIAYNIMGNIGLQLYLADGTKLLFGTQRPEAMKRAMKKLMVENEQPDD